MYDVRWMMDEVVRCEIRVRYQPILPVSISVSKILYT